MGTSRPRLVEVVAVDAGEGADAAGVAAQAPLLQPPLEIEDAFAAFDQGPDLADRIAPGA